MRRGDPANYTRGIPSFEDLLAQRIRETEAEIKQAREIERRASERMAAWVPKEPRAL